VIRRIPTVLTLAAALAIAVGACNGSNEGPPLTDPSAIVTAALKSTEDAKSVHVDLVVDGSATVSLLGGAGTPVDLTGTTAAADVDFANDAVKATFAVHAGLTLNGELIVVDGTSYLKTGITGPLYRSSPAAEAPFDPAKAGTIIDNLGDLLLEPAVSLIKGTDTACGTQSCYTVTTDLTADDVGLTGPGALSGLPIDLTGATLHLTILVEKSLPYHLARITAVLAMADDQTVTAVASFSKWDVAVAITAPPADQVQPGSSSPAP
jgi:hypothetical protein